MLQAYSRSNPQSMCVFLCVLLDIAYATILFVLVLSSASFLQRKSKHLISKSNAMRSRCSSISSFATLWSTCASSCSRSSHVYESYTAEVAVSQKHVARKICLNHDAVLFQLLTIRVNLCLSFFCLFRVCLEGNSRCQTHSSDAYSRHCIAFSTMCALTRATSLFFLCTYQKWSKLYHPSTVISSTINVLSVQFHTII